MTALSSATSGSGDRAWSARRSSRRRGREGLLDELHAQPLELRAAAPRAYVGRPARVGVDPERAAEHRAHRADGLEVRRDRRTLTLSAGKSRRPARPLGDDRRLVDPEREVGRRDGAVDAEEVADRAGPAACRRGRGGRCRWRTWPRHGGRSPRPSGPPPRRARRAPRRGRPGARPRRARSRRAAGARRRRSSRASRRRTGPESPRPGRRAVGPVGIVPELRDDRRRDLARAVGGTRDHERVAQRQDERPQPIEKVTRRRSRRVHRAALLLGSTGRVDRLREPDPRQRVHAPPRSPATGSSPPKRTGSSHGSPVSAAVAAMIRRASSSSVDQRGVERDRDDLRRRDQAGHRLVGGDERAQRRDREPGLRAGGRSRGRPCRACGS